MAQSLQYNPSALPFYEPQLTLGSQVLPQTHTGYDVQAARLGPARRAAALERANGAFSDGEHKVLFFATDVQMDLGLSGVTAQGLRTRDFYAHNIVIPAYRITGQCLDQWDYGILVEFVHKSQQAAVSDALHHRLQFDLTGGGLPGGHTMKGIHKPISLQGYVLKVERKNKQGEYSPIFTIQMEVAEEYAGIFKAVRGFEHVQASWWEILEGQHPFSQAPKEPKTPTPTSTPGPVPQAPIPSGTAFGSLQEQTSEQESKA